MSTGAGAGLTLGPTTLSRPELGQCQNSLETISNLPPIPAESLEILLGPGENLLLVALVFEWREVISDSFLVDDLDLFKVLNKDLVGLSLRQFRVVELEV